MSGNWTVDALLSLAVAAAWAICWGFLVRRRRAIDNLHYPSIIAAVTGTAVALAGLFSEGLTPRVGKLLLLEALALVSGLVLSNALARAAIRRAARQAHSGLVADRRK